MIPLWLLAPGVQAGSSVLKYAMRKKTPSFANSAQGKYLKRLSTKGKYNAAARNRIIGETASSTGNIAQKERAGIRGYLAARGMDRSISSSGALYEPEQRSMSEVAKASRSLTAENELSKQKAKQDYALGSYQTAQQHHLEEQQSRSELIGGLASAGASAAATGYKEHLYKKFMEDDKVSDELKEMAKAQHAGVNVPYYHRPASKMSNEQADILLNAMEQAAKAGQWDVYYNILMKYTSGGG